jgi:hypothetical protein
MGRKKNRMPRPALDEGIQSNSGGLSAAAIQNQDSSNTGRMFDVSVATPPLNEIEDSDSEESESSCCSSDYDWAYYATIPKRSRVEFQGGRYRRSEDDWVDQRNLETLPRPEDEPRPEGETRPEGVGHSTSDPDSEETLENPVNMNGASVPPPLTDSEPESTYDSDPEWEAADSDCPSLSSISSQGSAPPNSRWPSQESISERQPTSNFPHSGVRESEGSDPEREQDSDADLSIPEQIEEHMDRLLQAALVSTNNSQSEREHDSDSDSFDSTHEHDIHAFVHSWLNVLEESDPPPPSQLAMFYQQVAAAYSTPADLGSDEEEDVVQEESDDNDDDDDDDKEGPCPVCYSRELTATFTCGHLLCFKCAKRIKSSANAKCHTCRAPVTSVIRIYQP